MIPKVIKNFNGFIDGVGQAGKITQIVLPTLTLKTEEHKGGGMDAPVEIDMGMEAMTCTMTHSEYGPDIASAFGLIEGRDAPIVARGSQEKGAAVTPVIFTMRGGAKTLPGGTFSDGKTELEIEYALTYARLVVGGTEIFEVDVENMIRRINGVDQLAARRAALAMS
jgi:P2 family phage contractile tail tube protein